MRRRWAPLPCGHYEASSDGLVRRIGKRKPMSMSVNSGGYFKVTTTVGGQETTTAAHRLIARAFLGHPRGRIVNHIDGDKQNNAIGNLEYTTPAGNSRHAVMMGLVARGERHGRRTKPHRTARGERVNTAILTADLVRAMRRMRDAGATLLAIAAKFGMSKSGVHGVCSGKNWRHVA